MTRYDHPLPPHARPTRRMRAWAARLLAAALLTTAVGLPMGAQPQPAAADTAPPEASLPATVSSDPLPTAQHNGVVWSQVVVGNTVYAAGEFTRARPAGTAKNSASEVVRTNLLAYNITTGALTAFAPTMNGKVKDIAASPDGTAIYIGGQFTKVNGVNRNRLAAFNTSTGALTHRLRPEHQLHGQRRDGQCRHRLLRRCLHHRQRRHAGQRRGGGPGHRSHPTVQRQHDGEGRTERAEGNRLARRHQGGHRRQLRDGERIRQPGLRAGHGRRRQRRTAADAGEQPDPQRPRECRDHRLGVDRRRLLRDGLRVQPNAGELRGRLQGRLERQPDLGRGLPRRLLRGLPGR